MKIWKRLALVAVPSVLLVGSILPAVTHAEDIMSQQQAQEMLSNYGEEGLRNMGLSLEQLAQLKLIASGAMAQPVLSETLSPASQPEVSTVDPETAKNLLANFGVDGLLGMGLTIAQVTHIQVAAGVS